MRKYNKIINKRLNIYLTMMILIFIFLACTLFYNQIIKNKYYKEKLNTLNNYIVYGNSAPRGRIYDRNGVLLVDNKPVKTIVFSGTYTTKEKLETIKELKNLIELDLNKVTETMLKEYYLIVNTNLAREKITKEEWEKYNNRLISSDELYKMQKERITSNELNLIDKKEAYLFYLINKGYSYDEKIIKENVTEEEYAKVAEALDFLKGVDITTTWERVYLYGDTFRTILGSVNNIPSEQINEYLAKGYSRNDLVGISFLEYQYEDILKGTKDKYVVNDGVKVLVEEGKKGNDIYLTIDINLQLAVEEIMKQEMIKAKNEPNSEYYDHSFVIISDPKSGEILAMAGKKINKVGGEYKIYDYAAGITTSPVTVGSVIKGASHIVGYNTGNLTFGEVRDDVCIKLKGAPQKCSYQYYGRINDLEALKYSSNTYQFRTAMKVANFNYSYDSPFKITNDAFNIYRTTFNEFGLGVKTNIDLPVESLGLIGNDKQDGLLLDFAIGQYDTYTPIQLTQYINTIANNGTRVKPHLLKKYVKNNEIINIETEIQGTVNTEAKYIERVQEGFRMVLERGGTGYKYIDLSFNPAGKTGTSQSFLDTNNDGKIDTATITNTFAGYAPSDNPVASFVVISPDVGHYQGKTDYHTFVNRKISYEVSKKFFEIYK